MNYASYPLRPQGGQQTTEDRNSSDFIDLERLAAMALRQSRVVIIGAIIGIFLGILYLQTTPRTYTAFSNVLVDEGLNKIVEEGSATAVNMQTDASILSQIEIIRSLRLATAVVENEKLYEDENFLNPPSSLLAKIVGTVRGIVRSVRPQSSPMLASTPADNGGLSEEDRQAAMVEATKQYVARVVQAGVLAQRVGRSYAIAIAYQSHDPALAQRITKAYADAYVADQLNASFEATERTAVWLQGRLEELRTNSQAAALAVEKYRSEQGLTAAKGELIAEQQLSDLNSQLILAQGDVASALARYDQYKGIVAAGPDEAFRNASIASNEAGGSAVIEGLKTRYIAIVKREQEISSSFGPEHAQAVLLRNELNGLSGQIFNELKQRAEAARNAYEVARSREEALRQSVARIASENSEANESQVHLRELEQKSTALSALYQTFLDRYEQAAQQRSFPIAQARVITQATMPMGASGPSTSKVLAASLLLGLMVGGAFGALNEFNERFFRTGEQVRDWLKVKFLGYLPLQETARAQDAAAPKGMFGSYLQRQPPETAQDRKARMRIAIDSPASIFAETLRNAKIATNVVLHGPESKVIGIVSVLPGEGKSTVAANLALLFAASGANTLLIDADLRNPGLTNGLGIKARSGLVEAVVQTDSWRSLLKTDRQMKFSVLPAIVRNRFSHSSELLSSPGMRALVEDAKQTFDVIVVDLPPVGAIVDAKAFAPLADGFIVVTEWGKTPRALVDSFLRSETSIAGKVIGLILNKVDLKKLPRYTSFGNSEKFLSQYSNYYLEGSSPGVPIRSTPATWLSGWRDKIVDALGSVKFFNRS